MSEYQHNPYQQAPNPYGYAAPPPPYYPPPPGYYPMPGPPLHALAEQGMRLVARILDGIFVLVVIALTGLVLGLATLLGAGGGDTHGAEGWVFAAGGLLGFLLYEPLMNWRYGATLGKRICRLRVARIHDGKNLSFGAALGRWAFYLVLSFFVPFGGLINALSCLWDKPFQQCFHDKVANSVVVKRDPAQASPASSEFGHSG